jgi:hypothetical protein
LAAALHADERRMRHGLCRSGHPFQEPPSIAGVAAVHALRGSAPISGLATDFIQQVTPATV